MNRFVEKLFGDPNKRVLKQLQKDVEQINGLESSIQQLSDEQLHQKTTEFRERLNNGAVLDDVKHEAFAVVREAARRTLGQRHYDVQLIGGLVLHRGGITEMKTGEGKTLVATTATYLNALEDKGVHVVTVNDYLARRDADWMGQVYHFLGLTVGCIQHEAAYQYDAQIAAVRRKEDEERTAAGKHEDGKGTEGQGYEALVVADMTHLRAVTRKEAYRCDVLYGTNNEFGFDYLRDNMVYRSEDRVQRGLHFAVIDEVDSILIDEARTPLIISAPAEDATEQYYRFAQLVGGLQEHTHFTVDEKQRSVALTDAGIAALEQALGVDNIYVASGIRTVHHIEQALKARMLFHRDKDYVIKDDEVVIIDEFTGRMMYGRRYSEGLHQAIEAKENMPIKKESRTLATITLQNLFRMYPKLSGMTGTAQTEAEEFFKIYGLEVSVIPTHRDIVRKDVSDRVYKSRKGKFHAVIEEIKTLHAAGRPVLVGTISIEQNEMLSQLLSANGIPHNLLNAKQHEREAEVIAQAGKLGAVTVATNMAGRGVDIILGGNPMDVEEARTVRELGGLCVLGTERHEARRIDNQLRGRSGRQGDPGSSQFFVSMDDELLRIFGSDRMKGFMNRLGVPEDMPIENGMVSRSIESAQKKVEGRNFDIRKHLVEYDDVMNKHREVVYRKRNEVLTMASPLLREYIMGQIEAEIEQIVSLYTNGAVDGETAAWDIEHICDTVHSMFSIDPVQCTADLQHIRSGNAEEQGKLNDAQARTAIIEYFTTRAAAAYETMVREIDNPELVEQVERGFVLRAIDALWVEHLDQMSFLRDSIGLRGYGQRDPLVEYKHEAYQMFQELLSSMQHDLVYNIFKMRDAKIIAQQQDARREYHAPAKEMQERTTKRAKQQQPFVAAKERDDSGKKIGRNDPCPCGSGKKYKKCHGAAA